MLRRGLKTLDKLDTIENTKQKKHKEKEQVKY
jgi:hypothetical protein